MANELSMIRLTSKFHGADIYTAPHPITAVQASTHQAMGTIQQPSAFEPPLT